MLGLVLGFVLKVVLLVVLFVVLETLSVEAAAAAAVAVAGLVVVVDGLDGVVHDAVVMRTTLGFGKVGFLTMRCAQARMMMSTKTTAQECVRAGAFSGEDEEP